MPLLRAPVQVPTITQAAQGLVSETFDRALARDANAPASGALRAALLPLARGQRVQRLWCYVFTGQPAGTAAWLLLYSLTGALLGQSASTPNAFTAAGLVPLDLLIPYDVPASAAYFAAVLLTSGGAIPTLSGSAPGGTGIGNAIGTGAVRGGGQAGLATPPDPAAIAAGGLNWVPWIGAS